ncbi:MAG: Wzz/FepE/Etk N-terminal domain-containing protein [Planctomycetota bacterium]|jgi:polysaccharide chain length determinant protein (PEP-CTERM system associated)
MSSHKSPREIVGLVIAHRLLVAAVALSVLLVAVMGSLLLPRKYESSTRVRVVDNAALYEIYGRSLPGAKDEASRIQAVQEALLSPSLITRVADELSIDGGLGEGEREDLFLSIQESTTVDLAEKSRGQFIFEIAHTCEEPVRAQRVVTRLSTGYRNRQLAEQGDDGAQTLLSVREKVAAVNEEYESLVGELEAFEKEHESHRFGQPDDTRTRHEKEREKLDAVDLELQEIDVRLKNIREQMDDEEEWITVEEEVDNTETVEAVEKEIQAAEQVLLGYQLKYTDAHPKVIAQKEKIASLKKKLEEESGRVRKVTRKERNPTWTELKKSEMEAITNLTVKREIRTEYDRRVKELEARMQAYPELKAKWDGMVGRKGALEEQREKLREQEQNALLTWQTKVAESAVILNVLEPPSLPFRPKSPNQTLIAIAGLFLGLGAGVVVVVARDVLDRSYRDTDEVVASLNVPVLGSIATIETPGEREFSRRKKKVALAVTIALLVAAIGVMVLQARFEGEISSFVRDTVSGSE